MSGGLKDRGASPEQTSLFKDADQRSGHRQRLKDRFVNGGPEALPYYELLEQMGTKQYQGLRSESLGKVSRTTMTCRVITNVQGVC
jgi:DNA repair protein RadC